MRKKVYFSEIIFTDHFYIDGVDICEENNLEFLGLIDIDLKVNLSFSKIDNAKLYKIKALKIKIVIAEIRDFKIVCYMKSDMLLRVVNHPRHKESIFLNYQLLEEFVINKIKDFNDNNCVYSKDYKTRALIVNKDSVVSVQYQTLEIEDLEDYYLYEGVNSNNFWNWENISGVSYYESVEAAKKDVRAFLENYIYKPNRFYNKPYKSLWRYESNKVQTWLYMMKYALIGSIFFIGLSCLLPLCGQSNWNILWLSGGCSLFALIVAGIQAWNIWNSISYEISDKGIHVYKGWYYETTFDNIKKIKIKRNLFNKNKGSIKFKLYKGLAINYNFDNIENAEEAYEILKKKIN